MHGEALVACAAWAVGEAGIDLVDASVPWAEIVASGRDLVLHDALCPMTPPGFLAECLERARTSAQPVIGVRPVTDTIKRFDQGLIGSTVDREGLLAVASPLVVPSDVLATCAEPLPSDLRDAVLALAARGDRAESLVAPPQGRRVSSLEDVRLVEALTRPEPAGR